MKTLSILFVALLLSFSTLGQTPENYINKTRLQVREILEARKSLVPYQEDSTSTGDKWYYISPAGGVGAPSTNWMFDKTTDRCYHYSFQITDAEEPYYKTRLKNSGLPFDKNKGRWVDAKKKTYWTVTGGYVSADLIMPAKAIQ